MLDLTRHRPGSTDCAAQPVSVSAHPALWETQQRPKWPANLLIYNQMVVDLPEREADRIFHALADATRRDLLARAILREQSVSALASHYEMSFAAVQKHVAVLERARLIIKQRRGREQIVHGNAPTLRKAAALLDVYEHLWIQRATQIADVLSGEEGTPT
jgi:DNA-binding transcriptional ArsR family regulator